MCPPGIRSGPDSTRSVLAHRGAANRKGRYSTGSRMIDEACGNSAALLSSQATMELYLFNLG